MEKCLICEETAEGDSSWVSEKGMKALLSASLTRRDGREKVFSVRKTGVVHVTCRKRYTRPSDVKRASKQPLPSTSDSRATLRSEQSKFEFRTKCFLCTETIDNTFYQKQIKLKTHQRRKVFHVRSLDFDQTIAKQVHARNDKWGEAVLRRIGNVPDLHAADAVYHEDCYRKFFLKKSPTGLKRGRPQEESVVAAMEEIFHYLDENDKGQYTMDELLNQISGDKPEVKWLKVKLEEKYGSRVIISKISARKTVVRFLDVGENLLNAAWYASRLDNEEEESLRVVTTAAGIIRQQIQSQAYETKSYPPSDDFLNGAEEVVPPYLSAFMKALILPNRNRGNTDTGMKKVVSISHAIISAVRPRSFLSSVLSAIAYLIHRKFGSKHLIQILHAMGFSASPYHTDQLEISALYQPQKSPPTHTFCQYVFDNADFNITTLDGLNTFHSLGGIKCVTPAKAVPKSKEMKRITSPPSAREVGKLGVLEVRSYNKMVQRGLKNVVVQNVNLLNPIPQDILEPSLVDTLWMCGKWLSGQDITKIPEWKGFMHLVCEQINPEKTAVIPLPFITSSPSDKDTLYTALRYAAEDATRHGLKACFVTMDQPLYLKCREIVASSLNDPLLKKVEMILGGFHTLMSFLGCIGQTMAGSGLKDLLCCAFAPNSVEKMLSGKAYSRAVRGHLLVQTTLAQIILEKASFSEKEKQEVLNMYRSQEEWRPATVIDNTALNCVKEKLNNELSRLKSNGPTAALWVQYFSMVTLMKKFIVAQRRGDWQGHLTSTQQMIPFFHASGHFHYAKCTHLYVQDMLSLPSRYPDEKKKYMDFGYFSVNRSGTQWAGVWSDMAIEQTLMCDMKSQGGLTRGRGLTDSVLAKWVAAAHTGTSICSSLEEFTGCHCISGEQHVDFRDSRIKRDAQDRKKLADWLAGHSPFAVRDCIMSLSTGVIGSSNVNCHKAAEIGSLTMKKYIGSNFADMIQSKKNTVVPLSAMNSTVEVNNETIVVDPSMIFQRTLINKKTDEDVADLLKYELSPYPMSLFDEGCFRKNKKSALYDTFPPCDSSVNIKTSFTVVDGGFLLHRVKWSVGSTFSFICGQYVSYIITHYGSNSAVVFDGYEDSNSIKRAEQKRRGALKFSVEVNVSANIVANVQQENFLANNKNKAKMIELLADTLTERGIEAITAAGDADRDIVLCGLRKTASHSSVVVIGEDVDLPILLTALTPLFKDIYFLKAGRGFSDRKIFSTRELQGLPFSRCILFLHTFSGCDSTSAIYGKSKITIVNCYKKTPAQVQAIAEVFYNPSATPESVAQAGEEMMLLLYQAPTGKQDLNVHRYKCFVKSSMKTITNLASLPPTKGSTKQHSFRAYLQVQLWLGNTSLDPQDWGWAREEGGDLNPVKTKDPPAPANILDTIFCRCVTGCSNRCGCRKAGIHCSIVCGCQGACLNCIPILEEALED